MNQKKDNNNKILTEPILKILRGTNFAFLATVNKDGSPQVTPTWIDITESQNDDENGLILINTAKDRVKQKNVSRDPRVSISLVDESN
ncbi:MAG: pyridoxamine 5'-phosphate oxidase family protein, partial [Candidatus Nitrosocosmicus sp.]